MKPSDELARFWQWLESEEPRPVDRDEKLKRNVSSVGLKALDDAAFDIYERRFPSDDVPDEEELRCWAFDMRPVALRDLSLAICRGLEVMHAQVPEGERLPDSLKPGEWLEESGDAIDALAYAMGHAGRAAGKRSALAEKMAYLMDRGKLTMLGTPDMHQQDRDRIGWVPLGRPWRSDFTALDLLQSASQHNRATAKADGLDEPDTPTTPDGWHEQVIRTTAVLLGGDPADLEKVPQSLEVKPDGIVEGSVTRGATTGDFFPDFDPAKHTDPTPARQNDRVQLTMRDDGRHREFDRVLAVDRSEDGDSAVMTSKQPDGTILVESSALVASARIVKFEDDVGGTLTFVLPQGKSFVIEAPKHHRKLVYVGA